MRISVFGCGYLGAVHAACMATLGHEVVGIDVVEEQVASLSRGEPPFYEPGLAELLDEALGTGRLRFTTDASAAAEAELHFICVGTPQRRGENGADLTYVHAAVRDLLPSLNPGDVVVGKSTVPLGTAEGLLEDVRAAQPEATLLWNPEFLREGHAVQDTLHPDRFVYGIPDDDAGRAGAARLDEVYAQGAGRRHPQDRDRPGHRPDGQGGGQLVPRDEDLVHQRDG